MMKDRNPQYVRTKKGNVATRCRICNRQLTHPDDIRQESHSHCLANYRSKIR